MNYGDNIKKLRNRLGLNQTELGNKLKVTQVTVSAWETNVRNATPKTVNKLIAMANKFGLTIRYEDLRPL